MELGLAATLRSRCAWSRHGCARVGLELHLPHFTAVVPSRVTIFRSGSLHISSDYGSVAGELVFQDISYHYAVWLDTLGYFYASRWNFGSSGRSVTRLASMAMAFVTEPGWTELLAHDAAGTVTTGSLQSLKDASLARGVAYRGP